MKLNGAEGIPFGFAPSVNSGQVRTGQDRRVPHLPDVNQDALHKTCTLLILFYIWKLEFVCYLLLGHWNLGGVGQGGVMVELRGFEPLTFSLRTRRSPY